MWDTYYIDFYLLQLVFKIIVILTQRILQIAHYNFVLNTIIPL